MRSCLVPLAATLLSIGGTHSSVFGEPASAVSSAASGAVQPQKVEIRASAEGLDFSDAAAQRAVVARAELTKYGDTQLGDALRRVPGVTVERSSAGKATVRLRGLGEGYTQILVNGEPTAPDFSIDSIPISTIEAVEVLRVGTVDLRTAGIAGTINIVLRKTPRALRRELKGNVSQENGRASGVLDGFYGDADGPRSYLLGASVAHIVGEQPAVYEQTFTSNLGERQLARHIDRFALNRNDSLTLTPNVTWRPRDGETLRFENVLRLQRYEGEATDTRTTLIGSPPDRARDRLEASNESTLLSSRINWVRPLDGGGKLDLKFSVSRLRRDADSVLYGFSEQGTQVLERRVTSQATDDSALLSGIYRAPYSAGHALSAGWDAERSLRSEDRIQHELTSADRMPENLDESYTARIRRVAAFVQDEWDVSPATLLYLGVRWEGLQTSSTGNKTQSVSTSSSVVSPVLQLRWKASSSKDQVRLALGRAYKAPTTIEMIPRRWVVPDNTPTSPNFQGNASLKPELAWGLDLSYEHHLANAGVLTATAYGKRIDDVILRDISLIDGVWVLQPVNRGTADVHGIELDGKVNVDKLWPNAPALEFKFNVTRAWSRVNAVPGPDNRLDRQKPYSGNIGFDYRMNTPAVSFGMSCGVVGGGPSRTSTTLSAHAPQERRADAYAVWNTTPSTQVRLAISRKWRSGNAVSEDVYADDQGEYWQSTREPSLTTVRLGLQWTL